MLPFERATMYAPLAGILDIELRNCTDTKEGLDRSFALFYYSRIRLIMNLLPLIRQSPRPRVLSVLNGGREKAMLDDDIGLENPQKLRLPHSN